MRNPKREAETTALLRLTERSSAVLLNAAAGANSVGCMKLQGANVYLYAAMLVDFSLATQQDDWIGPKVSIGESVKRTEDFVLDHLFDTLFAPIRVAGGNAYLAEVRKKAGMILASRNGDAAK